MLVPLPSQAPANFILDSYFNDEKHNRRLGSAEADILEEFVAGMKVYFDKALGKILLYRFERNQLGEVSCPAVSLTVLTSKYRFENFGKVENIQNGKEKVLAIATVLNTYAD